MAVHLTLGALEVGVALSTLLYGVTTVQAYMYACSEHKDGPFLRLFVLCVWIIESLHTLFHWVYIYLTTVTYFGQLAPLESIPWYLGLTGSLGTLSSLTQAYFAYRVKVVSGKWFVAIVAWTGALLRLALGSAYAIIGIQTNSFFRLYNQYRWVIVCPIIVDLIVDIWNTGSLCYYLAPKRPDRQQDLASTRKVINRIMLWSVETGLVTCVCAMLTLIFALALPETCLWVAILAFQSKLYAISLLISLNGRTSLRHNQECLNYCSILFIEGACSVPPIDVTQTIRNEMTFIYPSGTNPLPENVEPCGCERCSAMGIRK